MPHITDAQFRERFTALYFSGQDLPKKPLDRQIILISTILGLDPSRIYSESELNGELQKWVLQFGRRYNVDHVTLRRYLIDERYLVRTADGSAYQLGDLAQLPTTFDATLAGLDLVTLIDEAKAARELKKSQYLKKTEWAPVRGVCSMTKDVQLREVVAADLPVFFEQQLDPEATRMAAFPSRNREAFMAHWAKILRADIVHVRTILYDAQIAGNILCWEQDGRWLIGYWLGKEYWGKGIATRALTQFLQLVTTRPLYAEVAKHNLASKRVLEKCGFVLIEENGPSPDTPGEEFEGYLLKLE